MRNLKLQDVNCNKVMYGVYKNPEFVKHDVNLKPGVILEKNEIDENYMK